ncbi:hypothetical protein EON65_29800 [archaeon]|nr:MAG: hypothetical protein EON65_29800 [archaeon]
MQGGSNQQSQTADAENTVPARTDQPHGENLIEFQFVQLSRKYQQAVKLFQQQVDATEQLKKQHTEELTSLAHSLQDSQQQNAQEMQDVKAQHAKELQDAKALHVNEASQLQALYGAVKNELLSLQQQYNEKSDEHNSLHKQYNHLVDELHAAKGLCEAARDEITTLNSSYNRICEELGVVLSSGYNTPVVSPRAQDVGQITQQLKQMQINFYQSQEDLAALQLRVQEMEQQHREEISSLSGKAVDLKAQYDNLRGSAEANLVESEQQCVRLSEECDGLKMNLAEAINSHQQAMAKAEKENEEKLLAMKTQYLEAHQELLKITSLFDACRKQLEEHAVAKNTLQQEVSQLKTILTTRSETSDNEFASVRKELHSALQSKQDVVTSYQELQARA